MLPPRRRTTLAAALTLSGALLLSACSTGETASEDTASGNGEFPITIANTYGETEIPSKPERVASVAWGNHDVAVALGVVPVGMAKASYGDDDGDGIHPWTLEALEELGAGLPALFDETDGIAFEEVANTEPDLILAAYSGLTEEDYATLSEIAPTVSFPEVAWGTNWRDMALINGEALGLRDEAEELITEVEQQIADAVADHPAIEGKSVAYTMIDPSDTSSIYVYMPIDSRVQFVEDLGLTIPDSIGELGGDEFFITISGENADVLADADILVTYGTASTLADLQADPLLGTIPAVQNGAVVVVEEATPLAAATSGPTVLSIPFVLEDYVALFGAAAEKVK